MFCSQCGKPIQGDEAFCPFCGVPRGSARPEQPAPPVETKKKGKRKRRKRRRLLLILGVVLALMLVLLWVLFRAVARQNQVITETAEYSMALSADRTDFTVQEDGTVTLTVHSPDAEEVGIYNEAGECLATLTSANLDEDGNWSVELDITTEEDTVLSLTARSSNGSSMPLNLYVTTPITGEMMQECGDILEELTAYLSGQGYQEEDYDEETLDLAAEWLSADERVDSVSRQDTMTTFITVNHVAGAFALPEDENTLGSGDSQTYQEAGQIAAYYRDWAAGGELPGSYLYSENTLTNTNALVLSPLYTNSIGDQMAASTDLYEEILTGEEMEGIRNVQVATRDAAVGRFLGNAEPVADNGMLLLVTHGGKLSKSDGSTRLVLKLWERDEATYEWAIQSETVRVGEVEIQNQLFYGTSQNPDTVRLYLGKEGVFATSRFIMDKWQDCMFDNTIVYFGVCYGASDEDLIQFFLSHGASAFISYPGSIVTGRERDYFRSTFTNLSQLLPEEQRCKTITEAVESLEWRYIPGLAFTQYWVPDAQVRQTYTSRPDYTLYGYGELSGTVAIAEEAESVSAVLTLSGARVTAYRYLDHTFVEAATTTIEEDGAFSFSDLEYGVYAVVVEKLHFQEAVTGIIFQNREQDGGVISLIPEGNFITGTVLDEETKLPVAGAEVSCMGEDGLYIRDTEEDGTFVFENLGDGDYTLQVSAEGYFPLEGNTVTLQGEEQYRILQPFYLTPAADHLAAYAALVQEYEEEHGFFGLGLTGWCAYAGGVNYLNLVDMDGDGTEELLVGYMDSFAYDYGVEVWTYRNGEAVLLGTPGCYLIGVEGVAVCTAEVDGQPVMITGSANAGYQAWGYDGESLQQTASYTEAEVQSLDPTIWEINVGNTDRSQEERELQRLWSQVREVREMLGGVAEIELAQVAYQFELLYNEEVGYYACLSSGNEPRFEYIYVDEDEIPELIISLSSTHAEAAHLYTYESGSVVSLGQFGAYGTILYSERDNLIRQSDTHMGLQVDRFGKIENGAYESVGEFSAEYADYSYETPTRCRVDGQEVTYQVYQQELSALTEGKEFQEAGYMTGTDVREAMMDG